MTRQTGFVLDDKKIMPDLYFYRDPEEQEKEEIVEVRDWKEPAANAAIPEVTKIDEVIRLNIVCKLAYVYNVRL